MTNTLIKLTLNGFLQICVNNIVKKFISSSYFCEQSSNELDIEWSPSRLCQQSSDEVNIE